MDDEKSRRERRKVKHDEVIWTVMVAVIAGVVGMWLINFIEARVYCIEMTNWLALPKGEGEPPSPTGAFDPNLRDYLDCMF